MKLFGRCLFLLLHLEMTQWEANNFVSFTLSLTFPVSPEATVEDKSYVFFFLTVIPSLFGQVFSGQTMEAQLKVLLLTTKATVNAAACS